MNRPRPRLAIRARLTLLFTGLLAAALLVFGGGLYLILRDQLQRSFDGALLADAAHVAEVLAADIDPGGRLQPPEQLIGELASTGGRVLVLDPGGSVVVDSADPGAPVLTVERGDLDAAGQGSAVVGDFALDSDPLRFAVRPVRAPGGPVAGYVVWADSTRPMRDLLGSVSAALVAGGVLVAGLALIAGWLLAGRALSPVADVTETARAIALSGDFAARVEAGPQDDEVGDLAVAFNEMLAALEENHQALQRFLGDASHQLRSPLTTIRASLDLAARPGLDEAERRAILADARAEAERMGRLVSDLLALARAEAGARLELAPVELDAVLVEAVRQARQSATHVRMEVASVEPAPVDGDRDRLKELFLIVLDNAARYTPDGGAVSAALEVRDGKACVTVADTGIGIGDDERERVFERAYRGARARQLRPSGIGLGLTIARWITDVHGGTIDLARRAEGGTTVSIRLPLRSA